MEFSLPDEQKQIIDGCIKGDRKCQQQLHKLFYGKMLAVCCRYATDRDEAKDILQDGFIKVFQRIKSYESKGALEGWVRRIIVNNAIDHIRKKRDFVLSNEEDSRLENLSEESSDILEEENYTQLKAEIIMNLIQKLSPAYKAVFNMYVLENLSHKEIADMLGINVGTSKSNLAKAKARLKEMFDEYVNNCNNLGNS
ncbi:MAG: RNA polymerase sigma factor [Bacteroidales bacterium]|nr:RNA polymerase sigma factor [Bacteroidales bacterium]